MAIDWDTEKRDCFLKITQAADEKQLEALRVELLGKKGKIASMYGHLADMPDEQKPQVGKKINEFRSTLKHLLSKKKDELSAQRPKEEQDAIDVTIPGVESPVGHAHILTQTINEICGIFERLGFVVQEGPEIETEFNNFTALNIPADHPSRDGFDTFYLKGSDSGDTKTNLLLRSHTSPAQIRIMEKNKPPLAVIVPGKVYRPDAIDASHASMFHQIEGLLVDKSVKFSDLKGLITVFLKQLFGEKIKMRFRPHFFPFTEPSAEVDISCHICQGKGWLVKPRSATKTLSRDQKGSRGCSVCGRKGWLEIMGCGMVHPKVFTSVGYPKGKYTGLAFGLGVERMTMLRHGIHDIRLFYENDVRFLKQF